MCLLMGLVNFFLFHPLRLNEIKFHNLFHFDFYKIIIILKKILGLVWRLILRSFILVRPTIRKQNFFLVYIWQINNATYLS